MSTDFVLLTGASGHVGFRTLRYALEHDYKVRAVVRGEQKAETVRSKLASFNPEALSKLSFEVVPDFTKTGAFDSAMIDITHVIHIASPLASETPEDGDFGQHFIRPALNGTLNLLRSSQKLGVVQRIVITSSGAAITPLPVFFGMQPQEHVIGPDDRVSEIEPPYSNSVVAYTAAKIAALNQAEAWMEQEHPNFDLVHIFPSFVYGRDDLCLSTRAFQNGTNRFPLNVALGKSDPQGIRQMPNSYNFVDDCAMVHVRALEPHIPGNQGYIVSSSGDEGMTWQDVHQIARKRFPDAVDKGMLPNNGTLITSVLRMDNRRTEQAFDFKHADFETMVVSVIGHYLELLEDEN